MLLGVHVSGVKKLYETFDEAERLGCNTMQIFAHSPQVWQHKPIAEDVRGEFLKRNSAAKVRPVFIHAPYLINLASPDKKLYQASIEAYTEGILEAGSLKVDYFVTHMGSHRGTSEEAGIRRLIHALNKIAGQTKETAVKILLENTAGSGSSLGYTFMHHREIFRSLTDKKRFGLCFDTAHAYAAGYDIAGEGGLKDTLAEIQKAVGLRRLELIHLNDSRARLGSRLDRHQDIGKGYIGLGGFRRILNHPALKDMPFILETPKKTKRADAVNLNTVRKLRKG